MTLSSDNLELALNVLQEIADDPALINHHDRFKSLITKIYKQGRKNQKQQKRQLQQAEEQALIATTAIVQSQCSYRSRIAQAGEIIPKSNGVFPRPKACYICNNRYTELHFFYHSLCPICAEFNYQKRHQRTNLNGRVALITGGRIKIGYQTALRLLRDGAKVIVTTRFPRVALQQFSTEPDFSEWQNRLLMYGLDLRNLPAVESFIEYLLNTESSLDILINNAAQTIKRPLGFYQHLIEQEQYLQESLTSHSNPLILYPSKSSVLLESQPHYPLDLNALSSINLDFPANTFDSEGQQLDRRSLNSWKLKLDEISTLEMLEVQLVNAVAPFMLNSKLKPLFLKSPFPRRFIINVSAMEGQFNRVDKTIFHPHTNMAKAGLNMMTRTSGADYAIDGIYMNSVDTGWITDENPYPKKMEIQEKRGFYTPLDIIDGMARIYDPIVQGIENSDEPVFGQFLKNYVPYPW